MSRARLSSHRVKQQKILEPWSELRCGNERDLKITRGQLFIILICGRRRSEKKWINEAENTIINHNLYAFFCCSAWAARHTDKPSRDESDEKNFLINFWIFFENFDVFVPDFVFHSMRSKLLSEILSILIRLDSRKAKLSLDWAAMEGKKSSQSSSRNEIARERFKQLQA